MTTFRFFGPVERNICNINLLVDKSEAASVDRFLRDTEERWKTVSVELYCAQSMLEEVVAYWRKWKSLSAELENWIDTSRYKLNASEVEKAEYFQVRFILTKFFKLNRIKKKIF